MGDTSRKYNEYISGFVFLFIINSIEKLLLRRSNSNFLLEMEQRRLLLLKLAYLAAAAVA